MSVDPSMTEFSRIAPFKMDDVEVTPRQLLIKSSRGESSVEPKVMALLVTLAERSRDTWTRAELIDRIWGIEFGGDESLTRAVHGLRKALAEPHDLRRAVKTLPKVGYRLDADISRVAETVSSPLPAAGHAAVQGRATSIAAGSANAPAASSSELSPPRPSGIVNRRNLLFAGGAVLLAASAIGFQSLVNENPAAPAATNRIVILPFENATGDDAFDYVASGISGEIRHSLSRNQALNIVARRSSEAVKAQNLSSSEIADEFGPSLILDGRVSLLNGDLRLSTELIEAQSGELRWTDVYSAPKERLLTVQSAVTGEVTREVTKDLSDEVILDLGLPTNPAAFDMYLRAKDQWQNDTSVNGAIIAARIMDSAIELDPDFALAYTSKAIWLGWVSAATDDAGLGEAYLQEALTAAERAIELEPELADVHSTLAWVRYLYDLDFAGAPQLFERSLELAPNDAVILTRYASFVVKAGKMEEAQRTLQAAISLDPLNASIHRTSAMIHYYAGKPQLALAAAEEGLKLREGDPTTLYWKGRVLSQLGKNERAIDVCDFVGSNDLRLSCQGISYARANNQARALEAVEMLSAEFGDKAAYQQAQIYAALGQDEKAIQTLQLAWEKKDAGLVDLKVDPVFTEMRNQAEFLYLLQSIGFDTA